ANRGHWTDIGGMTPGGWSGAAEHAVQEGVRIPGVRLMRAGVVNEAVRGFILRNGRVSTQLWGDIQAQIASNVIAERRIRELIAVTDPDIPLNDAIINAIESVIPPGTLVNPNYPAPTFSASADPAARVAETMLRALAKLVPDRVPAGAYATGNNVVAGGVKADGQPYLWYNFESGGCGARPGLDGNSAEHHLMGNSKNESAEVWEARYPVRVLSYRLVDDSAGAGRWRGGMGTERRIQLL